MIAEETDVYDDMLNKYDIRVKNADGTNNCLIDVKSTNLTTR